ncbi:TetR family transcriptional regulator [Chitinophaga oryziterrae]|uniref:TetR family transcriptional regulator n=2 Tax=Chitinophaga oryziterrae TaxID=1031224 RepID=A0A6N8JLM8_9BACT|nr:TetR family transcriptional regulator [Chitinophaga oryziterrae]
MYQMVGTMNESKEHILVTSLRLFLQKNFKEVTMKQIVEETGMSKGAFYHYFSSKEQVFEEVIQHFFMDMMSIDFSKIPFHSLKQFYTEILAESENKRKKSMKLIGGNKELTFTANLYYLIFDAMKILPGFKETLLLYQKEEVKAWTARVKHARENGEIESEMSDAQLAKLFIYTGDGIGISRIMEENSNKIGSELKPLWDGLYKAIKV